MLPSAHGEVEEVRSRQSFHVADDEDEETLAAIDEGMRDADTGRTVPSEEVRQLLRKF